MKRRKTKRVLWLIFYHGVSTSFVSMDLSPAWHTKKAALAKIAESDHREDYTVEKYVRDDS